MLLACLACATAAWAGGTGSPGASPRPVSTEAGALQAPSGTLDGAFQGVESLAPPDWRPEAQDGFQGPRTLLSSGFSAGSDGSALYQGLVGWRATQHLSLFALTQGGSLAALSAGGGTARVALPALATLGFASDGYRVMGWDASLTGSFTPSLGQLGLDPALSAGGSALSAADFGWGSRPGFSLGTSFSRDWGSGFSTVVSVQMERNSPLSYDSAFGPAAFGLPGANPWGW